jgi:hypothetical protein
MRRFVCDLETSKMRRPWPALGRSATENKQSKHDQIGVRSRLTHCATRRMVAGSIPDGVVGIFHLHNPSGVTMVQVYFLDGTGGQSVGLTTLPSS